MIISLIFIDITMATAENDAIAMPAVNTDQVDGKQEETRPDGNTAALEADAAAPSKKSLKRMVKRAKYEDIKKLKRKAEKERMKLKRLQAKENGTLMPITRKTLLKTVAPIDFAVPSARVVVDMSFDQHMTTAEKVRTCKQLLRVYTLNRRAPRPMPVYFCGLKQGTEQMEIFKKNDGYQHWDVRCVTLLVHGLLHNAYSEYTFRSRYPKATIWKSLPRRESCT